MNSSTRRANKTPLETSSGYRQIARLDIALKTYETCSVASKYAITVHDDRLLYLLVAKTTLRIVCGSTVLVSFPNV